MKPTTSRFINVIHSKIHGNGVSAKCLIPKGTKIIEYVGERITKKESDIRADIVIDEASKNPTKGAVYIFELNGRYDIDGNVPYNTARFINHSCDPNCETENYDGHIWIIALRDILEGEELSYNYGYSYDDFEKHECKCGSPDCLGYIVAEEHWPKVRRKFNKPKSALPHHPISKMESAMLLLF